MAWLFAARADEITPGAAKIVEISGKQIGVFYEGGEYYAVLNYCPHRGAPICRGKVFGAVTWNEETGQGYDAARPVLRCPWHRWEFDLCSGAPLAPIKQRIKTYAVRVENNEVWVDV